MTILLTTMLRRHKVSPDIFDAWLNEAIKRKDPLLCLYDKANQVRMALAADYDAWCIRNLGRAGFMDGRARWEGRLRAARAGCAAALGRMLKRSKVKRRPRPNPKGKGSAGAPQARKRSCSGYPR